MPVDVASRMQLVIEPSLRERVKSLAKAHRRTTSAEICIALEAWLDQHKDELPAA
jgi:hypothetical protein